MRAAPLSAGLSWVRRTSQRYPAKFIVAAALLGLGVGSIWKKTGAIVGALAGAVGAWLVGVVWRSAAEAPPKEMTEPVMKKPTRPAPSPGGSASEPDVVEVPEAGPVAPARPEPVAATPPVLPVIVEVDPAVGKLDAPAVDLGAPAGEGDSRTLEVAPTEGEVDEPTLETEAVRAAIAPLAPIPVTPPEKLKLKLEGQPVDNLVRALHVLLYAGDHPEAEGIQQLLQFPTRGMWRTEASPRTEQVRLRIAHHLLDCLTGALPTVSNETGPAIQTWADQWKAVVQPSIQESLPLPADGERIPTGDFAPYLRLPPEGPVELLRSLEQVGLSPRETLELRARYAARRLVWEDNNPLLLAELHQALEEGAAYVDPAEPLFFPSMSLEQISATLRSECRLLRQPFVRDYLALEGWRLSPTVGEKLEEFSDEAFRNRADQTVLAVCREAREEVWQASPYSRNAEQIESEIGAMEQRFDKHPVLVLGLCFHLVHSFPVQAVNRENTLQRHERMQENHSSVRAALAVLDQVHRTPLRDLPTSEEPWSDLKDPRRVTAALQSLKIPIEPLQAKVGKDFENLLSSSQTLAAIVGWRARA